MSHPMSQSQPRPQIWPPNRYGYKRKSQGGEPWVRICCVSLRVLGWGHHKDKREIFDPTGSQIANAPYASGARAGRDVGLPATVCRHFGSVWDQWGSDLAVSGSALGVVWQCSESALGVVWQCLGVLWERSWSVRQRSECSACQV